MRKFLALLLIIIPFCAFGWNSAGHRIIGEIAYEHLTPKAKEQSTQLIEYLSDAYPYTSSFQTASAWADYLKQADVETFNNWHYYNLPYDDAMKLPYSPNLLWALNQSLTVLKSQKSNQFEKAFFIRFLLHLVGDAHQPLHCINRNDDGANDFPIINDHYHNLHAYWDAGLGLFDQSCGISVSKKQKVNCYAEKFQEDYPESYFGHKINNVDPNDWINESYQIGKSFAYQTPENKAPSSPYITEGRKLVEQQIALAGYRLANVLNSIFDPSSSPVNTR